ncbi:MAG TPA: ParA family protein [Anaerolineaceae bacterium]|nr:ParA family protein [Anaerolineaceae bacterium]
MTYIVSITNEKGGVAKTTTVLSLGAALADTGKRVLLIDLDPQANLSLSLGFEPEKLPYTAVGMMMEHLPFSQVGLETPFPGLSLIACNHEMSAAERVLPTRPGYETMLRQALKDQVNDFDFILMDCPPFLGAVVMNALAVSDLLIIPTQAEYFSLYALRNMMGLIRRVRAQLNPRLTYRLLLTLFDQRNRIHRTLSEQLHESFGNGVLETVIQVDTKLRESSAAGRPITLHAPRSRAAEQYRALASEIMAYVKETAAQPA